MKFDVPDGYKYVADRAWFVASRRELNLAFMLSKHAEDADADWLNSDLYKRMEKQLIDALEERTVLLEGVVELVTNRYIEDVLYWRFSKDDDELEVVMYEEAS